MAENLEQIAAEINRCQKCPLAKMATQAVPGAGNPKAKIVFIGEAPGYWEDQKGIPFVGAAGHLLDKLLASINLRREEIFITNILKHRPPNNRDPLPAEIKTCSPFLRRQLLVIQPEVIVTLGRFAMNFFLPHAYISRVHGEAKPVRWEGLDLLLVPMYHPAAALRNGQVMQQLQDDFQKLAAILHQEEKPAPPPEQTSLF